MVGRQIPHSCLAQMQLSQSLPAASSCTVQSPWLASPWPSTPRPPRSSYTLRSIGRHTRQSCATRRVVIRATMGGALHGASCHHLGCTLRLSLSLLCHCRRWHGAAARAEIGNRKVHCFQQSCPLHEGQQAVPSVWFLKHLRSGEYSVLRPFAADLLLVTLDMASYFNCRF